jgi:hypothetical protein
VTADVLTVQRIAGARDLAERGGRRAARVAQVVEYAVLVARDHVEVAVAIQVA